MRWSVGQINLTWVKPQDTFNRLTFVNDHLINKYFIENGKWKDLCIKNIMLNNEKSEGSEAEKYNRIRLGFTEVFAQTRGG